MQFQRISCDLRTRWLIAASFMLAVVPCACSGVTSDDDSGGATSDHNGGSGGDEGSAGPGEASVGGRGGANINVGGISVDAAVTGGSAGSIVVNDAGVADDGGTDESGPVGWVRGVVAVGYGGIRALSRDGGKTWTKTGEVRQRGGDDADLLRSVAFGNGMWVAGGWDKMWTSPDGATWTLRPHKYGIIQGLAFGNGMFIATTKDDDVYRSADGLVWTALGRIGTGGHTRCIFGNGLFAASGNNLFTVTSPNGQKWQRANVKDSVAFCEGAFKSNQECFGHERSAGFWVPGLWARQRDGNVQLSSDGKSWKLVYEPKTNALENLFVGWVPPP